MDDADRADALIENVKAGGIAAARLTSNLVAAGFCHWCGESVGAGMLFCGADCRDDYDHEKQMKTITGTR